MAAAEVLLVYDAQCPLCNAYCRVARIRKAAGTLRLVNAREAPVVMAELTRRGLDIDQGMVLQLGDRVYYGADAIHALALLSTSSGVFNRLNHWIFRSAGRAKVLYPILRSVRNLLLKALRKTKINNLQRPSNDHF